MQDTEYVPPTVSSFKETVDSYAKEIWCNGTRTGSHTYPSTVRFYDGNRNEYRLAGCEPDTHMGCGCWTGIEVRLERLPDDDLELDDARRVVAAARKILERANAWAAANGGRAPVWSKAASREERLAAARLDELVALGRMLSGLAEEDSYGIMSPENRRETVQVAEAGNADELGVAVP